MAVICKIPRKLKQKNKYYWKQYYILTFTKYYYDVTVSTYYLQPDNPNADTDGYVFGTSETHPYAEYDTEQSSYTDYGANSKTVYSYEFIEMKTTQTQGTPTGETVQSSDSTAYPPSGVADDGYWYELITN